MSQRKDHLHSELSAYLDGELPPRQAKRLAQAIAADADLRAEYQAIAATRDLLRQLPREPAPAGLREAVMSQIEHTRLLRPAGASAPPRAARWPRAVAAAAVVLLTIGLGWNLYTSMKPPATDERVVTVPPDSTPPAPEPGGAPLSGKGRALAEVNGKDYGGPDGSKGGTGGDGRRLGRDGRVEVRNIVLCTDNLSDTNNDVLTTLAVNGITAAKTHFTKALEIAPAQPVEEMTLSNVAYVQRATPVSNKIVLLAEAGQVADLIRQLKPLDRGDARRGEAARRGGSAKARDAAEHVNGTASKRELGERLVDQHGRDEAGAIGDVAKTATNAPTSGDRKTLTPDVSAEDLARGDSALGDSASRNSADKAPTPTRPALAAKPGAATVSPDEKDVSGPVDAGVLPPRRLRPAPVAPVTKGMGQPPADVEKESVNGDAPAKQGDIKGDATQADSARQIQPERGGRPSQAGQTTTGGPEVTGEPTTAPAIRGVLNGRREKVNLQLGHSTTGPATGPRGSELLWQRRSRLENQPASRPATRAVDGDKDERFADGLYSLEQQRRASPGRMTQLGITVQLHPPPAATSEKSEAAGK